MDTTTMMRTSVPALSVVAVAALLGACSGTTAGQQGSSATSTPTGTSASSSSSSSSSSSAAPSSPGSPTTPAAPAPPPSTRPSGRPTPTGSHTETLSGALTLETDGLGLSEGTSTRHLRFGTTDRATLTRALTATVGAPTLVEQPECGQGPRKALVSGRLTALFDGTRFVGWAQDGAKPRLTTAAGIGIGSPYAEVAGVYDVTARTSTLGPEFTTKDGRFGGFLSAPGTKGTVTGLYAGETCFFR